MAAIEREGTINLRRCIDPRQVERARIDSFAVIHLFFFWQEKLLS